MKRRTFGLLAGTSLASAAFASIVTKPGAAQAADASLLQTTLTPFGAERAGNSSGSIPAWTGGMTEVPAGITWDPERTLPPDFWADEQPLYEVNASNMAQYAPVLTDGVQNLIQNKGLVLKVYTTHRTASAPQWVYDNTALNVTRAVPAAGGLRYGFTGAYGGVPFPIPDTSDPLVAGAQCIWNHETRWGGSFMTFDSTSFVQINGVISLASALQAVYIYPYYQQGGTPDGYDGYYYKVGGPGYYAPANEVGGQIVNWTSTNPFVTPNITWQLLAGQGRVRKAPEVQYDTPSSYADGLINYDEYYGFNGAADRYDWKLLGKREVLIPYNNNRVFNTKVADALGPHIMNPDCLRWELHRVWVVDATLHPGERNVLARRRFYFDEDTWLASIFDAWDGSGNIFHHGLAFNGVFPNLPGTIFTGQIIYNLQTNGYVTLQGVWADEAYNKPWTFGTVSLSDFNPQSMAAAANY